MSRHKYASLAAWLADPDVQRLHGVEAESGNLQIKALFGPRFVGDRPAVLVAHVVGEVEQWTAVWTIPPEVNLGEYGLL